MNKAIEKLSKLENVLMNVDVNTVKDQYLGVAKIVLFNPEQMIPNGGPVTKKDINVRALGSSFDEAYNNVLEKAVALLGL